MVLINYDYLYLWKQTMQTITTVLIDDHTIVRDGIEAMLAGTNVLLKGNTGSVSELYQMLKDIRPDVLLLDPGLPGVSGLDIAKNVSKDYPDMKVIVLTANNTEHVLTSAVRAGAKGFLDKGCTRNELVEAINEVANGGVYFSRNVSATMMKTIQRTANALDAQELTDREIDVLKCFAHGHSYKETARLLSINVKTVESHKKSIFEKLGFSNNADLVPYAVREGMIEV